MEHSHVPSPVSIDTERESPETNDGLFKAMLLWDGCWDMLPRGLCDSSHISTATGTMSPNRSQATVDLGSELGCGEPPCPKSSSLLDQPIANKRFTK